MMSSEKTYIVHARERCPFCVSALNLLSTLRGKATYCVFFHENKGDPKLLQEQKKWNWDTVPIVVESTTDEHGDISQRLIGGYTDLCLELGVDPNDY
jgi:glutaredoxin